MTLTLTLRGVAELTDPASVTLQDEKFMKQPPVKRSEKQGVSINNQTLLANRTLKLWEATVITSDADRAMIKFFDHDLLFQKIQSVFGLPTNLPLGQYGWADAVFSDGGGRPLPYGFSFLPTGGSALKTTILCKISNIKRIYAAGKIASSGWRYQFDMQASFLQMRRTVGGLVRIANYPA